MGLKKKILTLSATRMFRSKVDPPCSDSLRMHAERATYQVYIWRNCLESHPDIPLLLVLAGIKMTVETLLSNGIQLTRHQMRY